tara:strand:- start:280 stop:2997 length:2718 start_codon:yes stop_codon:yes gene_type:complete
MKIALLPGGFKPPHLGHYNMAKYLADFADKVIIRIGSKEREGIGKELALEIWSLYKEFDPDPRSNKLVISVAQSPSPVRDVYDFVEQTAPEGSTIILGLGEKDASDGRYNSIPKFAEPRNIKAEIELVPPQAGGISGTRMREIIKANNKEEFFKFIPDYLPEEIKEEIWTKLLDSQMPREEIHEFGGGTMNKKEMDKHNANMKKLSKHLSKVNSQGNMVPVPRNLTKGLRRKLYEGRYDQEVLIQSRYIINLLKSTLGEKHEEESGGNIDEIKYTLETRLIPGGQETLDSFPYIMNGLADEDTIIIQINYNPSAFPEAYNDLIAELKDTLRHELEHVGQFNFNKGVKLTGIDTDDIPPFEYYTLDYEIPAFVQGLYKKAKTKKITLTQSIDEFLREDGWELTDVEVAKVKQIWVDWAKENLPAAQLDEGSIGDLTSKLKTAAIEQAKDLKSFVPLLRKLADKSITPEEKSKLETISKDILKSTVIGVTWPILGLTGHALIGAAIKKLSKGKYAGFLPSKLANVVEYKKEMKESKLFSKEWWSDIITEEIINEGGAAGHMAHPFDLPNVKTGKDLISSFEQAADSLKKEPGAVKIDGVNASIRLLNNAGKREFAMDRGSKKALDLRGVTKADLEDRFGPGHGMITAGGNVLDIFNSALSSTEEELNALGLLNDPNVMFNMEYVSGKSNVQDYGKNFLAIHGLLSVETKEVQGARKMLTKRVTTEKNFDPADMEEYLKKLEPFAKKKGFEIYGSVPTTFTKEPDFKAALGINYTIDFAEGDKTKSLSQWLNDVNNIPKSDRLKMNVDGTVKDVGALSKQVYFAVFGGENVDDLFDNDQDIQKAIQGATTYLATEKLGDAILDVLDSPMGSVNDHEGVVIRDPKVSPKPYKITGKFITGGVSSQFQTT